jgi:uncharacterized membrane protein YhhN
MFPRISYSENTRQLLFVGGLIAFLLAHLSYMCSFLQEISTERKMSLLVGKPFLVLPFVLYLILFLKFLMPYLGPMKFPVFIYGVCITSMCVMAFNRWKLAQQKSFALVFCGACFFLLSDTILSCNIFYKKTEWGRFAVMFSYIAAQAMIILGVYENKKRIN